MFSHVYVYIQLTFVLNFIKKDSDYILKPFNATHTTLHHKTEEAVACFDVRLQSTSISWIHKH